MHLFSYYFKLSFLLDLSVCCFIIYFEIIKNSATFYGGVFVKRSYLLIILIFTLQCSIFHSTNAIWREDTPRFILEKKEILTLSEDQHFNTFGPFGGGILEVHNSGKYPIEFAYTTTDEKTQCMIVESQQKLNVCLKHSYTKKYTIRLTSLVPKEKHVFLKYIPYYTYGKDCKATVTKSDYRLVN